MTRDELEIILKRHRFKTGKVAPRGSVWVRGNRRAGPRFTAMLDSTGRLDLVRPSKARAIEANTAIHDHDPDSLDKWVHGVLHT